MGGKLSVTQNQSGGFYKAFLNGERINSDKLFEVLGISSRTGFTLEKHVYEFEENNPDWDVECWEIDVS